ncbi:MAG TPA: hypothetical protein VN653_08375 [Anaerolineales bacterium]|nr:hypothetical protein [Anaerolineales bacterium]
MSKDEKVSFWNTIPGCLTGIAGIMTAIATLVAALYAVGLLSIMFPDVFPPKPTPTVSEPRIEPTVAAALPTYHIPATAPPVVIVINNPTTPPQESQPEIPVTSPSEIDQKYASLGGENGLLGAPKQPEYDTSNQDGRFRIYAIGAIYWSPDTGAFEVHGDIYRKLSELQWELGILGFPVTDELPTPDGIGRFNHFQRGSIYWTSQTGAHEVHGDIRELWKNLGWETGFLGYPLTDELPTPDGVGRFNHFQGGSIYWTPETGAHEVHGDIRELWKNMGWELGCLGYPVSNEEDSSGGWVRQSRFQHGIIKWSPSQGSQAFCN